MSPLKDNSIFSWTYELVADTLGGPEWLAYGLGALAVIMVVVNGFLLIGTIFTWMERKVVGRFQSRVGPNRVGPFGILQAVADAVKLLFQEDIVPRRADRLLFNAAPIVMLAPSLLALAVIPFGAGSYVADLNIGVLYVVAMSGIASLAVLIAGYASGNKLALLGSMRAVAMLLSYEIPLVMALLGITILAGSMSMVDIIAAQSVPFVLVSPLGALIFLIAMSAELNRPPFDVTEAESELVAGYLTEYSGMKFGVFYLAEFSNVVLAGALFAILFLDGWEWAILPSHLWFLIKVFGFLFVASWVRATLPRMRIDQILTFAWKYLFPLSLVNVLALAVETIAWPDPSGLQLWIMVAINWAIAAAAIPLLSLVVHLGEPARAGRRIPLSEEVF
ncbi:MAG: NADH-quinone oxidoreductase subunit NuoH [Chloroflexi bacterium]|nr:NADH-quinone oxidoreductase subunit NuoH [Chloroflexota bacterium]MDA1173148.1 NADH-quinone oxidoreductase subunit NuoH [Chloroflexota bacterium]